MGGDGGVGAGVGGGGGRRESSIKSHGYIGPNVGPCQKRCSGLVKIVSLVSKAMGI